MHVHTFIFIAVRNDMYFINNHLFCLNNKTKCLLNYLSLPCPPSESVLIQSKLFDHSVMRHRELLFFISLLSLCHCVSMLVHMF